MGKLSRNKGKVGEREVAKLFRDCGFTARRGVQFQGSPDSPDVVVEELADEFHIEVKRVERFQLYPALSQAEADSSENQKPLVFHRQNSKPWVVVLKAEDFLALLEELRGYRF